MRKMILLAGCAIAIGCGPKPERASPERASVAKAIHTASIKDTAFVRANCAMPDSVLAGVRPCIDRVQASKLRVF